MSRGTPTIIDTDPGIDDVVALALAILAPELDLLAVTTTYGNSTLTKTTRNARTLLAVAGRQDIRVLPGADRPLVRELVTAPQTHGSSGVGYAAVPPTESVDADPTALAKLLDEQPGPVTLVTLGPLTNLAHALEADAPLVRRRVSRHIGMFGSLQERGSAVRRADFNAWCDPEAVDRVLRADLRTVIVGLDVTRRVVVSSGEIDRLTVNRNPLASWLGHALRFSAELHRSERGFDGCVVNDVLPIGEIIFPGLLRLAEASLVTDLGDGENRGWTREAPGGCDKQVALGVDIDMMKGMLQRVMKEA